jgi:HPt (histidine-containing phosphotransfer) domain-containing protein
MLTGIAIRGKEKDMAIEIAGLDTNKGLELCDDEMNTYISTLRLYVSNIPAALDRMRNVSEETLRNYTISVHGVKSTSEVVGAEEARRTAKELEEMGKAGDLAGILARNDSFIKYVEGIVANIQSWLEKNEE